MSQRSVQLLIGQLVTDEDLRRRFVKSPCATLRELCDAGWELTAGEIDALLATDVGLWDWMAERLPSRLQRCSLLGDGRRRS